MHDSDKSREQLLDELALLRKRNRALKTANQRLQSGNRTDERSLLLDTIATHVFYLSDPETYGLVNRAHADFFGVRKSDLQYQRLVDLLDANEAQVCIDGNQRIFTEKKTIVSEELMTRFDGEKRLFAFTKAPKLNDRGDVEYVVCTGEDITEKKNADRLLTFTRFTIDQAKIAIFWCHADGRFFYVNRTACDWLGYRFDELKQMHVADINPEFPLEAWEDHWQDIKAKGLVHMESFHRRKNGEVYPVELYSNYVRFENEEYKLSFVTDISDKVKTRRALEASQYFLKNVIESIQDGISVLDKDHTIIHTNAVMREWYKDRGTLVGQKCFRAYHDSNDTCTPCPTERAFISGSTESEIVRARPDMPVEWFEVFSYPIRDDESGEVTGAVEFVRDISKRVKLERQLRHAQRMEALGTLAGGIAHDFNNLLLGVQGRSSLMAMDIDGAHPHHEHIRAIDEYIRSATSLTKQLLGMARGGKYEIHPIDISALVTDSAAMFGRTRKEIQIRTLTPPSPVVVEVDRGQIEQVLLNLYINAWQAMPDGGDLILQTGVVDLDMDDCTPYNVSPGRYAKVTVTDNGIGMDEHVRRKIFDPFFTTKEKSRGTGLGLALAYGIINNHGGFITVYSESGHGTTFNVHLPLSDEAIHQVTAAEKKIVTGSETILLVDDEQMILDVGQAMLQKLGYRVISAKGGTAAIDLLQHRAETIDLVILDLIMPGMDGRTTYERIRELRPGISVIVASGYTIDGEAAEIMQRGCKGFIQKPFNVAELSSMVRTVMDAED